MEIRAAISVSELNEYVRLKLANDGMLRSVEVTGEISGYKKHISGHHYFTLKDEQARVACVMFRQYAQMLDFVPQDGMRVTVIATASLYVRDGSFQLYVSAMRKEGAGELYLRFEALKRKLTNEGLFDPARKRELPLMPKIIGIATSKTGAAVRDMVRVARRRDPNIGIIIAPCAVQGIGAAEEIVKSIELLNRNGEADVILVGRGGGSIEDLWCFNEEIVARAIAASKIPVISCVGHETDFTIADFVADVRAATPSMAAELAVPMRFEMEETLAKLERRLKLSLVNGQSLRRAQLERLCRSACLRAPSRTIIAPRAERVENLFRNIVKDEINIFEKKSAKLEALERTLYAVSPKSVLDRGYAAIKTGDGYAQSVNELRVKQNIEIVMNGGSAYATVTEVGNG